MGLCDEHINQTPAIIVEETNYLSISDDVLGPGFDYKKDAARLRYGKG